ncbi:MAG TPA: outer membrane lipoprotein carrier protein LolA [Terriglobales bacterium]|nr:outer membrane lipoprotein carrier protein LolA [Terriglobales bacterium]
MALVGQNLRRMITGLLTLTMAATAMAAQTTTAPVKSKTKPKVAPTKTAPAAKTPVQKTEAFTPAATPTAAPAVTKPANDTALLEKVLDQLDKASAEFKSTEADFVWDQYQKVVDETDTQKGKVYFVRHEKDMHMAANITDPDKKDLVFSDGKLRFYQPRIDQVTEYDAGKNKAEVESFLVLGFGGRGHDLEKSFHVHFGGYETVDGVKTAKLELTPNATKIKSTFEKIILWVDPARGVSVKQQFVEPSGDYRIAKYMNFKMNGKVSDDVFKLKTTPKTKVVKNQ